MNTVNSNLHVVNSSALNKQVETSESASADTAVRIERSYRELPGLRHETKDVLKQLEANILLLEDLGGRLSFVMSEVRSLIRR